MTTSTPKPGYKPLASVTPFVPQQQGVTEQQQQQQQHSKEPLSSATSSYARDKYQTEGSFSISFLGV